MTSLTSFGFLLLAIIVAVMVVLTAIWFIHKEEPTPRCAARITPKGRRVLELCEQGMDFETAIEQAGREFPS